MYFLVLYSGRNVPAVSVSLYIERSEGWHMKAEHTPLWHLTGAAHVEGLDHSTEPIGCHGDDVLPVGVDLCFHDDRRVQQGRKLWCGARVVHLPLFEEQRGYLAPGGGGGWVLPVPVQLCRDEHQPLIQGVPQQLQRLQRGANPHTHTDRRWEVHRPRKKTKWVIHVGVTAEEWLWPLRLNSRLWHLFHITWGGIKISFKEVQSSSEQWKFWLHEKIIEWNNIRIVK